MDVGHAVAIREVGAALFAHRRDAGVALAARLHALHEPNRIVVGIANGGLEVGAEVAEILGQPLDAIVVEPLFLHDLLGPTGAVAEGEIALVDHDSVAHDAIDLVALRERAAMASLVGRKRAATIRRGRPLEVARCGVTLVSDAVTNGIVERAALGLLRKLGAERIVLAVPIAPTATLVRLAAEFDAVTSIVHATPPSDSRAWFGDARVLNDDEACRLRRPVPAWRHARRALRTFSSS